MKSRIFILKNVSFFLYCCIYLCSCNSNSEVGKSLCSDTVFVSTIWKNNKIERGRMINDLMKSNKLISLKKDSIINILGTPSEEGDFFLNYLYDMNCGKKKYGLMLFHMDFDSTTHLVTECFITD